VMETVMEMVMVMVMIFNNIHFNKLEH
jgi:hypothetical protein